eukprot:6063543-Amphidinium_carterae.1
MSALSTFFPSGGCHKLRAVGGLTASRVSRQQQGWLSSRLPSHLVMKLDLQSSSLVAPNSFELPGK